MNKPVSIAENIYLIDVSILNGKEETACYLIQDGKTNVLIDCGAESQFDRLTSQLQMLGLQLTDIHYVLLTHIHLDHAGAAWRLAKLGAQIYVHPFGFKNMIDPSKLLLSAKKIYLEKMDLLWGGLQAIPEANLVELSDNTNYKFNNLELTCYFSPGHAKHHVIWQYKNRIFSGDTLGCKSEAGPVLAPTPPPDIDFEIWRNTIKFIRSLKNKYALISHYGQFELDHEYYDQLLNNLDFAEQLGKELYENGFKLDNFNFTQPIDIELKIKQSLQNTVLWSKYQSMSPAWMNCQGALFYWIKKNRNRT